jgi:hypothetical protein
MPVKFVRPALVALSLAGWVLIRAGRAGATGPNLAAA